MNDRLEECGRRAIARSDEPRTSAKEANWTRAFFEHYADLPPAIRQARSFAYALENEPVHVFEGERLVGQIYQLVPGSGPIDLYGSDGDSRWAEHSVFPTAARRVRDVLPDNASYCCLASDGAFPGHVTWDWGLMLELGAQGLLARVESLRSIKQDDPAAKEFYEGVAIALKAMMAWAARHAARLEQLSLAEPSPLRRDALSEMAAICRQVPALPPRTFREAVQSFWFQYLAVMFENPYGGNGPGRLDWYLWPYLQADLAEGRITLAGARDLIMELFIKLDERIHAADGWVEAIVVGGRNLDGSSAINPLSGIIVEAILELDLTHPSVYVRLHDGAPQEFADLAVRYLIESENRGQVYNDDAVIAALIEDDTDPVDARHWAAGGCMEVGVQGMSGDLLFAFFHNLPLTLEAVLNGGTLLLSGEKVAPIETTLADYDSFEALYEAFERELHRELSILLARLDIYLEHYAKHRPSFLLSSMMHDCLDRGRAINDGGARYPNYGGSAVGIPNVGDSLSAIKTAVFDEKWCTGQELLEALRADFRGHERLRAYVQGLPKYGSGNGEAADMVNRVLRSLSGILLKHKNPVGGNCRPVILGFTQVVEMGLKVGASPDGRRAGRPLAQSMSPQSGSAVNGVTAAVGDVARLSLNQAPGGASTMWDIAADWAKPEFVRPIMLTFFANGGHIFQGNVTSIEQMIAAQQDPDEHRDLMVRVGGYSARFCALPKAHQDEIIERYRYTG